MPTNDPKDPTTWTPGMIAAFNALRPLSDGKRWDTVPTPTFPTAADAAALRAEEDIAVMNRLREEGYYIEPMGTIEDMLARLWLLRIRWTVATRTGETERRHVRAYGTPRSFDRPRFSEYAEATSELEEF
jgi:hypothetical protein